MAPESELNLELMKLIDEQYTKTPFYGIRRMTAFLRRKGFAINHKRVERLMGVMGLQAIYPKKRLSRPESYHRVYPHLLAGLEVTHPDQVRCADITSILQRKGFVSLVAVVDWASRYVLSWKLSLTLEASFCLEALRLALRQGKPEIFNSDQGSQFTRTDFISLLLSHDIAINLNFIFYNRERLHSALGYKTPEEVYYQAENLSLMGYETLSSDEKIKLKFA